MKDYNWEYINDTNGSDIDYIDSMTDGSYLDDEYYDEDNNEWQDYYEEIQDEIEY
jgi:hypothetical protein